MIHINEKIKNKRVIRSIYYYTRSITNKKQLTARAEKTLDEFKVSFVDEQEKNNLIKDMLYMNSHYGFDFDEFILYDFKNKNIEERLNFVADWEHLGYACSLNSPENDFLFDNKWKTYNKFKKFYGREVLLCNGYEMITKFKDFVNKHNSFISKPIDLSCGRGIKIIRMDDISDTVEQLFNDLMKEYNGNYLVEELIIQTEEIAKFHPSSVNTVRVPTIRMDGEVVIFHPFMRFGQGGKNVDNAGSGGIICSVDVESGKLTAAADEHGKRFDVHPTTNEQIVGFTIPKWEEAKALVKELAQVVPSNRYTGWDIALTNDGWIMVEANRRGQFIWQIPEKIGVRQELNKLLKRMNIKY